MREPLPELSRPETPEPADGSWIFTMLSEGTAFLPPDQPCGSFEPKELPPQEGSPLVAMIVIAVLVTLLIVRPFIGV